jgi:hypothetical protein
MTIDELRGELSALVENFKSSGFGNIDAGLVEKVDNYCSVAEGLGMKEGKHLLENFSAVLKSVQEGKAAAESATLRLTALDFYLNSISANGAVEDL